MRRNISFDSTEAKKDDVYVKVFLTGTSGSGKSYSSLRLATGMADELERIRGTRPKIIMFNTEGSRGRYYADDFHYNIYPQKNQDLKQEDFTTQFYIEWIEYTAKKETINGVEPIIIIDSATPAWDSAKAQQQKAGGQFKDWAKITPIWNEFKRTLVNSKAHIICCARGKTSWEIDTDSNGKKTVRKLGLGSEMRDGFDYEFTCCFMIDNQTHVASADKDNTQLFNSRTVEKPLTEQDGENLIKWANSGVKNEEVVKVTSESEDVSCDENINEYIKDIKNIIDTMLETCEDAEVTKVIRNEIATTIKKFVKNDKGVAVADYRIIKDVDVAKRVIEALNNIG